MLKTITLEETIRVCDFCGDKLEPGMVWVGKGKECCCADECKEKFEEFISEERNKRQ